jgi:quercetin dioxygenase-like cupin family protein
MLDLSGRTAEALAVVRAALPAARAHAEPSSYDTFLEIQHAYELLRLGRTADAAAELPDRIPGDSIGTTSMFLYAMRAQIAVLHGDPFKKQMFALRLKMPDGDRIAAHWHTQDEQLTILSGTFMLAMGDTQAEPHALEAGAYHFLPGKMHHSASAKGEVVLELHGMGPFDIHYVNPADNPAKAAAAASSK